MIRRLLAKIAGRRGTTAGPASTGTRPIDCRSASFPTPVEHLDRLLIAAPPAEPRADAIAESARRALVLHGIIDAHEVRS